VLAHIGEGAGVLALLESDSEGDGAASNAAQILALIGDGAASIAATIDLLGATQSRERRVDNFILCIIELDGKNDCRCW
jgi:hypothetical protein